MAIPRRWKALGKDRAASRPWPGGPLPGRTTGEAEVLVLALVGLGPGFGRRFDGRLARLVHCDGLV